MLEQLCTGNNPRAISQLDRDLSASTSPAEIPLVNPVGTQWTQHRMRAQTRPVRLAPHVCRYVQSTSARWLGCGVHRIAAPTKAHHPAARRHAVPNKQGLSCLSFQCVVLNACGQHIETSSKTGLPNHKSRNASIEYARFSHTRGLSATRSPITAVSLTRRRPHECTDACSVRRPRRTRRHR